MIVKIPVYVFSSEKAGAVRDQAQFGGPDRDMGIVRFQIGTRAYFSTDKFKYAIRQTLPGFRTANYAAGIQTEFIETEITAFHIPGKAMTVNCLSDVIDTDG